MKGKTISQLDGSSHAFQTEPAKRKRDISIVSVCRLPTHNDVTSVLNNDDDDDNTNQNAISDALPRLRNQKTTTAVKYYQELKVSYTKLKLKFSFPFVQSFTGGESLEGNIPTT